MTASTDEHRQRTFTDRLALREVAYEEKRARRREAPMADFLPLVADCAECGQRLARVGDDWFDVAGSSVCLATASLCENLCRRPHSSGSDRRCGQCDGTAEVYWQHSPVFDRVGLR